MPRRLPGGWGGYLCTDGYAPCFSINDGRAPGGPRVVNVACLVHVRRRFAEIARTAGGGAREAAGGVALEARRRIDAIFRADARLAQEPPEARREARMRDVAPLMRAFGEWASAREAGASPGLALHGALRYALRCWPHVGNALLDGRLALDNNIAERAVKPFVIGRKNWLFSDTPRGASASAAIYSVVETARANGLEPRAYVEWLLEEMPAAGELTDGVLDGFLPWAEGSRPASGRRRRGRGSSGSRRPSRSWTSTRPRSRRTGTERRGLPNTLRHAVPKTAGGLPNTLREPMPEKQGPLPNSLRQGVLLMCTVDTRWF